MNHLQKLRIPSLLIWLSLNFSPIHLKSSKRPFLGSFLFIDENRRYYSSKRAVQSGKYQNLDETKPVNGEKIGRISRATRAKAQSALSEYLHSTRCLRFVDAERMSRNSPHFLEKLLKKVENGADNGLDIEHSVARFLRYHPINEFELFFESLGLKPSEFAPLLPRNLMFLADDNVLLENYDVLCDYGIALNEMGKIYKEATEVFRYDHGILQSKLRAYEELGLSKCFVIKAVASIPSLLVGDVNSAFVKALEELRPLGIEYGWVEGHLLEGSSHNWSQILSLLCLFNKIGCNKEQLGGLISQHPELIFEGSGNRTFSLIGFLLKFGSTMNGIQSMFLQFPQVQVGKFLENMRQCYLFLIEIEMEIEEIGRIVRSHPVLLGSCSLKKTNSLLVSLNVGKKRLCGFIKKKPEELKNWVFGSRIKRLPNSGEDLRSQKKRIKFLLDLGFNENSNEMTKALKVFRGKGGELQERLDCFVKAGLNQKEVSEVIKVAPQVLNQSKDVIQMKIDFLVNSLGYPVSTLAVFPSYISYTIQRVKLRFSMYNWLKDQGAADTNLALSTILACPDKHFIRRYVNRHPRGPEVWEELKKQIYSD